jgi:choline dehydrogenase-like flavoprotein
MVASLSAAERQTLESVCETLLPALLPQPGDDPRLFALSAAALGLGDEVERAVATLGADEQRDFRRLLALLGQPAAMLLLGGRARPFTRLPPAVRERALLAMATSRSELLRTGFQALKRLATFLFYSACPGGAANPSWQAIGYVPSANPPPAARSLRLTAITAPTTLAADVCVIGSGAGGGVVAAELAAAGRRVVVLEAGPGQQAPDFDQRELAAMRTLFLDRGMAASRDLGIAILAGATLGGGTTVNWQTSLATPDGVRDEWAARSGCSFFTGESFSASLAAVAGRLGVGTLESAVNANNAALRRGCAALGYRWQLVGRNARGCDPSQCGFCIFGCRHGGKQTTANTFLNDAQDRGEAMIIAGCRAERVRRQGGKVVGVDATASGDGGQTFAVQVGAPIVVAAAGGIHSPALLLRSGVELPALGHHLYLHPATSVAGTYEGRIEPWSGPPQSILCDQFAGGGDDGGGYGFRLETAPSHPGLLAMATPWCGAADHRREMQTSAHKAAIIVLVRDRRGGRVRLGRDGRPVVDYRPGRAEQQLLRQGIATAARIHLAAGARELLALNHRRLGLRRAPELAPAEIEAFLARARRSRVDRNWSTLWSAHQMGTCRMGSDPRQAVCDADGEVFGWRGLFVADASAFPASSGVNPMLTIMALAHHTAQRIKARP